MTQDTCSGPTYTSPNGIYNATQVRLYGVPGLVASNTTPKAGGKAKKGGNSLLDIFTTLNNGLQSLFSFPIKGSSLQIQTVVPDFVIAVLTLSSGGNPRSLSAGVIFGYSYEGHCYDLPKPKVMLIPSLPGPVPAGDCGYDVKPGYQVWIVDKLDQCIDVDVSQGYVEQLVLDANLPGKRSPTMYAAKHQLAHRSGRLTD